ncbi:GTPase [Kocuria massiliensis]|uniref:GTPase n=1 Tax=Kocuria massiliensis TaxID=1926282 RepID=UPI000A1CC653|nr:GTPase [Kocuria massiliensis]
MKNDELFSIDQRAAALSEALDAGRGIVPDDVVTQADDVVGRVLERAGVCAEDTVVGFFGATGSGKSSLFNAVTGKNFATVAVTRPATTEPMAAVWGEGDHRPLTQWLGIETVHRLGSGHRPGAVGEKSFWEKLRQAFPGGGGNESSGGVVLVDLPDFDSIRRLNREVVERFAERVDVMVWVFDPQKYADHLIHAEFITPLSRHGGLMLAVLNQADTLHDTELPPVLDHLAERLDIDGAASHLARPPFAVSARDGRGIDELGEAINDVVRGKNALNRRLAGDLDAVAERLSRYDGGPEQIEIGGRAADDLAVGLSSALRADDLVEASRRSQLRRSARHTAWPPLRWVRRVGQDPLRRVGITRPTGDHAGMSRQALPEFDAGARATVSAAIRRCAEESASGVGEPWHHAVRDAGRSRMSAIPDALERAVTASDFETERRRWWWGPLNVVQWLALATLVVGLGWLTALFAADYVRMPLADPPDVRGTGIPVPTVLLAGGVALGLVTSGVAAWIRGFSARRHAKRLRARIHEQCRQVGEREVLAPMGEVLERRNRMLSSLSQARDHHIY